MKNSFLLFFALFMTNVGVSQSETLFSNLRISGFGGPTFSATQLNGETTSFGGGGGGVIIGDFFIGGFGEGGDLSSTTINNTTYDLDLGYGGLWMGYSFMSRKAIQPYFSVKWGSGEVTLDNLSENGTTLVDRVQVFNPEMGIEFNFTTWMRLVAHVGYREVGSLASQGVLRKNQVSGVNGGVTLRFGFFY